MKIYRNEVEIYDLVIDDKTIHTMKIMGEDEIRCPVTVTSELDLQIGDYIIMSYPGYYPMNYYINRPPAVEKISDVEFRYNIIFEGDIYTTLNKIYRQTVTGRSDFYLTATLFEFLQLWIDNMNEIDFDNWSIGSIPVTEPKNLYFNGESCRSVLNRLAEEFSLEFYIGQQQQLARRIYFYEKVEFLTAYTFEHGRGNGLYELTRENFDSGNTITRIFAYGAEKNLPLNYRGGERRLVFEERYLEDFSEYDKIVERAVIFNDIYPRFRGAISAVSGDYLTVTCPEIDFDINNQLMEGITAKIVFLSGDLMNKSFEILEYNNATKQITYIEATDDVGQKYPDATFHPEIGDMFTLVDIIMPSTYITNAETELRQKTQKHLDYNKQLRVRYSLKPDKRYLRDNEININLGSVVRIFDTGLGIDKQLRIIGIQKSLIDTYDIKADVSNYIEESWEKEITGQVIDAQVQATIDKTEHIYNTNASKDWALRTFAKLNGGNELFGQQVVYGSLDVYGESRVFWDGTLQHVATREDAPVQYGIPYWDGATNRFVTSPDFRRISGDGISLAGHLMSRSFQGGFAGSGWMLNASENSLTVDYLTVRKEMSVFELVIKKISAVEGALVISKGGVKVSSVSGNRLYVDVSGDPSVIPLQVGDFVRCQRWNGGVKYYTARVTYVGPYYIDVVRVDGTSPFEAGDQIVQFGHQSDITRQGLIYITTADDNSPYMAIYDGVNSHDLSGKEVLRLGRLNGIYDSLFGNLTGFGLYAENVFLRGGLECEFGRIGSWTIDSYRLSNTYNDTNHITLSNAQVLGVQSSGFYAMGRGLTIYRGNAEITDGATKFIRIGQLTVQNTYNNFGTTPDYGFQILKYTAGTYRDVFRASKDGAFIAGWNFDENRLFSGNIEIHKDGRIRHIGNNWRFNADGSFVLANGNFTVDASGNLSAVNANISGHADIGSGTVGGFNISATKLEGVGGSGGRFVLYPDDGYIAFIGDNFETWAGIGNRVFSAASGINAIARFENNISNPLGTNFTATFKAINGERNIAISAEGDVRVTGELFAERATSYKEGYSKIMMNPSSDNTINMRDGNTVMLSNQNSGELYVYLPSDADIREYLNVTSTTGVCFTIRVIIYRFSNGYALRITPGTSTVLIDNNGNSVPYVSMNRGDYYQFTYWQGAYYWLRNY